MDVEAIDEASFQARVLAASFEVPVVVVFSVTGPRVCEYLDAVLAAQAAIRYRLVIVRFEVRSWEEKDRMQLSTLPTMRAYRNGDVVDEFVGWTWPVDPILSFLDNLERGGDGGAGVRSLRPQPPPPSQRGATANREDD
jgi:thioredoxin-like negative regulator of GroEL